MKEIKLTQEKVALVDDWNYNWLDDYSWCVIKNKNNFFAYNEAAIFYFGEFANLNIVSEEG